MVNEHKLIPISDPIHTKSTSITSSVEAQCACRTKCQYLHLYHSKSQVSAYFLDLTYKLFTYHCQSNMISPHIENVPMHSSKETHVGRSLSFCNIYQPFKMTPQWKTTFEVIESIELVTIPTITVRFNVQHQEVSFTHLLLTSGNCS